MSLNQLGFDVSISPIIGYELRHLKDPTPHTRAMVIYGARIAVGRKYLSGEGEYTQGSVNETFPLQDKNLHTEKQNVKVGLRSMVELSNWLDFILRAGGQAVKEKVSVTTLSTRVTETGPPKWEIRPYVGTGLQISVIEAIALAAEATYLIRNPRDLSQNEIQTSLSLKVSMP